MSEARLLVGNVFDCLASMDDECVDLALTSPPFLALRSYLDDSHPDKALELGSEANPAAYLDSQLRVVAAVDRVLAPHGSIAWEIGDTYAGSGGAGGDYDADGIRSGQARFNGSAAAARGPRGSMRRDSPNLGGHHLGGDGWPLSKSLCGVPTLFAWSLAYGRNLLTGEPSPAGQWIVRNVVVWARPNPPVGALFDKFRPSTSYLTIATRARDRYFDLDAVRVPNKSRPDPSSIGRVDGRERARAEVGLSSGNGFTGMNEGGTPPNDWWEPWPIEQALWDWWADEVWNIPTRPYAGSHYAVWPPMLCVRPIKTMCPERVCRTCGQPSRRVVTRAEPENAAARRAAKQAAVANAGAASNNYPVATYAGEVIEHYWTDCKHEDWRPGCVLDPFAGSGTTLAVATGHGRDAIGIDLDQRNADLCRERIGLFLSEIVLPLKDQAPPPVEDAAEAML